jgi:hypothetical protein
MRGRILSIAVSFSLLACGEDTPHRDPALITPRHLEIEESEEAPPIAEEELPPPIADVDEAHGGEPGPRTVLPAAAVDLAYDSDEPTELRRFVYRVGVDVPSVLGEPSGEVETAAAELFVDVSTERVRARFSGPGWPALGEVRLRGDSPGGYVFDAGGGRPLLPGELAAWFEGGPPRAGPILMVRRDPALRGAIDPGPGMLICALLAEWAGESRDGVMRRCATGAPLAFRVGFWRGERMADVTVQAPRRDLRADQEVPPEPTPYVSSGTFLEPPALARLSPRSTRIPDDVVPDPLAPARGLDLVNESEARVLVVVDGVAIGWVDAESTGHFVGLVPGVHDVAAMRPLGAVVMRPREVPLPGRTVLHAPRRPPTEDEQR